jgi:hypothetical protein
VRSRPLLPQSPRCFDDQLNFARLEDVNRLTAVQAVIGMSEEVEDRPGIVRGKRLPNNLQAFHNCAIAIELQCREAAPTAGTGNREQASVLTRSTA